MTLRLFETIQFTANVVNAFIEKCVIGSAADRARCAGMVDQSLATATALAPEIGYEKAAKIAQKSFGGRSDYQTTGARRASAPS